MEKKYKGNSIEMTGNIASIGEKKQKSNGKDGMYVTIARNSTDGKGSFYPVYLDGVMLEKFENENFKVGDLMAISGKVESFKKESGNTIHFRPFSLDKIEKKKDYSKDTNNKEMDI